MKRISRYFLIILYLTGVFHIFGQVDIRDSISISIDYEDIINGKLVIKHIDENAFKPNQYCLSKTTSSFGFYYCNSACVPFLTLDRNCIITTTVLDADYTLPCWWVIIADNSCCGRCCECSDEEWLCAGYRTVPGYPYINQKTWTSKMFPPGSEVAVYSYYCYGGYTSTCPECEQIDTNKYQETFDLIDYGTYKIRSLDLRIEPLT